MRTGPSFRRHASLIAEPGRGAILASIALVALLMAFDMLRTGGAPLH